MDDKLKHITKTRNYHPLCVFKLMVNLFFIIELTNQGRNERTIFKIIYWVPMPMILSFPSSLQRKFNKRSSNDDVIMLLESRISLKLSLQPA